MTNDPESNGVDEPDVKVLINARSKIGDGGGVVPVAMIIPLAVPVLIMISISPLPQFIAAVFEKTVPLVPVTLKVTSIAPVLLPVNDGITRVSV